MNRLKFSMIILTCLTASSINAIPSLGNIIETYRVDVLTAFAIPAVTVYQWLSQETAEKVRRKAEITLTLYRDHKGSVTAQEVNDALDIMDMSLEDLRWWMQQRAIILSCLTGCLTSFAYYIRYRRSNNYPIDPGPMMDFSYKPCCDSSGKPIKHH